MVLRLFFSILYSAKFLRVLSLSFSGGCWVFFCDFFPSFMILPDFFPHPHWAEHIERKLRRFPWIRISPWASGSLRTATSTRLPPFPFLPSQRSICIVLPRSRIFIELASKALPFQTRKPYPLSHPAPYNRSIFIKRQSPYSPWLSLAYLRGLQFPA